MGELISRSEFARRIGVTEGAVRKHIRNGLYAPNRDGLLDFEKCKALVEANRDPDAALKGSLGGAAVSRRANGPAGDGSPSVPLVETSLSKARAAQAVVSFNRQKLALDREKGLLIARDDAYRACRAVVSVVTERMDGVPAQIAARVVGLDAPAIERVAREIINGIRGEIAKLSDAVIEVGSNGGSGT